jgi:hypothetical protein
MRALLAVLILLVVAAPAAAPVRASRSRSVVYEDRRRALAVRPPSKGSP